MELVKIYHPKLDQTIEVPESAIQILIMSGWQRSNSEDTKKVIEELEARLELERSTLPKEDVQPSKPTEEKPKEVLSKDSVKGEGK